MRRPRKHIPLREKLAAALALALPQELRDLYREKKVDADVVISQFEFDHIALHAFEGADAWHNLDPLLKPAHREKSRRDTGRAAKVVRLDDKWNDFMRAMAEGRKPPQRKSRWPSRRMRS
jgi:hypothetical protein